MTERLCNNAARTALMISALVVRPRTRDELAAVSGLSKPVVARWVKNMRAAGTMYIAARKKETDHGPHTQYFAWGVGGTDVPSEMATHAKRQASYRERKNAELSAV